MSSQDTQKLIDKLQQDMQAYQSQMDTARDRDNQDEIPGLQQKVTEISGQISDLQDKMQQEMQQEKEDAQKKAYEEGKEDGKESGLFGF
jgi:outer membrane murein-binding lipoprotein Lpp